MGIIKLKKNEDLNKENILSSLEKLDKKNYNDSKVIMELEDKRSKYSSIYKLNNGITKQIITKEASSYYDEDNKKWIEIDNSFVEESDCYKTKRVSIMLKY